MAPTRPKNRSVRRTTAARPAATKLGTSPAVNGVDSAQRISAAMNAMAISIEYLAPSPCNA